MAQRNPDIVTAVIVNARENARTVTGTVENNVVVYNSR